MVDTAAEQVHHSFIATQPAGANMIAIPNFRTVQAGAFKWLKPGQRRGYWRVLDVVDPSGPTTLNSRNVLGVLWESREGIDGVTSRSNYCLDHAASMAETIAARTNALRLAQGIADAAMQQVRQ